MSIGQNFDYQFQDWYVDLQGRIFQKNGEESKFLAAHRTFVTDCANKGVTKVIQTNFLGHENYWNFQRIGSFES